MSRHIPPLVFFWIAIVYSDAFAFFSITKTIANINPPTAISAVRYRAWESNATDVGDLLSDLPTPSLLLELSLAEAAIIDPAVNNSIPSCASLEGVLNDPTRKHLLNGSLFVHTQITDTSVRDSITQQQGSGHSHTIGRVDALLASVPGGAYLGIGLANHLVGGYYWARGLGTGASLPAHGVYLRPYDADGHGADDGEGELYWKKRGPGMNAAENTEESSNSNDGKRSEWADFVMVGDTVQLVPEDALGVLNHGHFSTLLGVRRIGRPLGADPIVERKWVWSIPNRIWVTE